MKAATDTGDTVSVKSECRFSLLRFFLSFGAGGRHETLASIGLAILLFFGWTFYFASLGKSVTAILFSLYALGAGLKLGDVWTERGKRNQRNTQPTGEPKFSGEEGRRRPILGLKQWLEGVTPTDKTRTTRCCFEISLLARRSDRSRRSQCLARPPSVTGMGLVSFALFQDLRAFPRKCGANCRQALIRAAVDFVCGCWTQFRLGPVVGHKTS